LVLSYYNL